MNKSEFRLVVAGGRDFADLVMMTQWIDSMLVHKKETHEIVIISGKANGADSLGERYAKSRGYRVIDKPADWKTYGKSAGYKRNVEMAEIAHGVVCFWDGKSKGTGHMINIARERNLPLRIVLYQ